MAAPPMPMILPKGIVTNTDYIYKEVASYPVVPPEKIIQYWKVYTTTFRKLIDPTANRLENFWWHVMGSDRRLLPGPTLARLFEDISKGPAFVPLRSSANRYEGPSSPPSPQPQGAAAIVAASVGQPAASRRGDEGSQSKGKEPLKPSQSSSSRPTPPHPILKKPSRPSAIGSRPNKARFVSPAGSEVEDGNRDGEVASSSSTAANSGLDTKPPGSSASKEDKKRSSTSTSKKKTATFVASTASKRRPAMPRRQSSQSSAGGSDVGSKEGNSSMGTKHLGSNRLVSPIAERPSKIADTKSDGVGAQPSAKATGKRLAVVRSSSDKSSATKSSASQSASSRAQVGTAPEDVVATAQPLKTASDKKGKKPTYESSRIKELHAATSHRREDVQDHAAPNAAPPMTRSRSDIGGAPRFRTQDVSGQFRPRQTQGLISSTTTTTSNVAAQGTIIEFDENAPANAVTSALRAQQDDEAEQCVQRPLNSFGSAQFTPTQPSTTPTVPLGRSKSQLTLLLERDGETRSRR